MWEQTSAPAAGVALLERAIEYALGGLRVVTPATLCRPTPCAGWNVQRLLDHMADSLQTLNDAAGGHITPARAGVPRDRARDRTIPAPADVPPDHACDRTIPAPFGGLPGGNPALLLRDDATEVLGLWMGTLTGARLVSMAGHHLTSPMVAAVGAIEITVHGWDVARSCGEHHPVPPLLADELLDLAHLFVTAEDRPHRFGPRVKMPAHAPVQDRLLAYLGRDPNWPACP
ncbi:hypothetical protein GBF35_08125 [Nonomuraea phyllanthi]|uniref:maleylpyruvate isomerase N-terminal domain-containing protein n=1 Tax=Nonomuraea phyllanthi TaxID=2219224 RepID=UPI001293AC27|nr:maleylpyruvate isomerase N-terminal domain-containing protein [Nonomuraea phyllanthi]QFY06657.1 hypothetical protein GBF35_08125 [Nonomuraea phyllanthi]